MRELSRHLLYSTRGQAPSFDGCYDTQCFQRGSGTAAGGAVRVPSTPLDDGFRYDVRGAQVARVRKEIARTTVPVFHLSLEGLRLRRLHASVERTRHMLGVV